MIKFKNIFLIFMICCFIGVSFFVLSHYKQEEISASDYLRLHIRANSNLDVDQNVKYKVKDEVVSALTPLLCEAKSKEESIKIIDENIDLITAVADKVLSENGFSYKSKAMIKSEYFPTRTYETLTLQSDVYDALIINLGSGLGDNWWCVAYPPMCFISYEDNDNKNVVYRSKIVEIIKNFFNR